MSIRRIQLTLFLDENYSAEIGKIRKEFNPIQYSLIRSHVTLCRENDLEQIEKVVHNLDQENYTSVTIEFGNAKIRQVE